MKTLALTGGGSAGHVVPNLALLPALRERFRLAYIGTGGIERELLKNTGVPFYTIRAAKLVRGSLLKNIALPLHFLRSVREAKRALQRAGADALFSKGGYVALPAVIAARLLRLPVLTHESDLTPGLANRIIARLCPAVLTSFPETAKALKRGKFTGPPVRQELFGGDRAAARAKYGFAGDAPVLLAFGGGSGSAALNAALEGALPQLLPALRILHICGKGRGAAPREGYLPLSYEKDMAAAYACADFVLARAGSNTLFEVLALKKPALFVPLENRRSRGDQVQNALYFEERGLCRVLRERDLSPASLARAIDALQRDTALRRRVAQNSVKCGNDAIVAAICELFRNERGEESGAGRRPKAERRG